MGRLHDKTTAFYGSWALLMCPPAMPMFVMTNSMLVWWTFKRTLSNVPLPLVIKPKFVVEALQWNSERRTQVQSHVDHTVLTS